jgi:hypothetical protein
MPLEPQWKRHVGRVSATLELLCFETHQDAVTEALGIKPTSAQTAHEAAAFTSSGLIGAKDAALWCYDTASRVSSSALSDHLRHLLGVFLPIKSRIEELRPHPHVRVRVYWESTMAGIAGPEIDAECISGLASLGATLDIRVAKIDEAPAPPPPNAG